MKLRPALTVARDLTLFGAGLFGLIHSEVTHRATMELQLLYVAMIAAPGTLAVLAGRLLPPGSSTEPPSSPSPEPEPSPPPSS